MRTFFNYKAANCTSKNDQYILFLICAIKKAVRLWRERMDDVDGGGGDGWARIRKKRRALQLLLESSDSSESEEELGPRGGKLVRAGGWGRKPRMGDLVSLCLEDRWRWPSWQSNWLNILQQRGDLQPEVLLGNELPWQIQGATAGVRLPAQGNCCVRLVHRQEGVR